MTAKWSTANLVATDQATVIVAAATPAIRVTSSVTPVTLPAGNSTATFAYTVTNTGTVPLSTVTLNDDTCAAIVFTGGDANGDSKLDLSETWTYACSVSLPGVATAKATVSGFWAA